MPPRTVRGSRADDDRHLHGAVALGPVGHVEADGDGAVLATRSVAQVRPGHPPSGLVELGAQGDRRRLVLDGARVVDQGGRCRHEHALAVDLGQQLVDLHLVLGAGFFGTAFVDRLDDPVQPADDKRGDRAHACDPEKCIHGTAPTRWASEEWGVVCVLPAQLTMLPS